MEENTAFYDVEKIKRDNPTFFITIIPQMGRYTMESQTKISGGIFSTEYERSVIYHLEQCLEKWANARVDVEGAFDLMSQKEVLKKFDISPVTLQSWEQHGLLRYQPPIEGSRKVYYKKSDLLAFVGAA